VANIALRRARKAQRRKQVVAGKRQAEAFEASLAGQVGRAAEVPIQHCLLTESLFESGLGTLVLARGRTPHYVALSTFLIDTFCLGIKDVMFRPVEAEEFATYVEIMGAAAPLVPVEPGYARRLLRELAAWAQSIGFPPHRDFTVVERTFGTVDAGACDVAFRFGRDGKPFYVPGPTESPSLIRRRLKQLQKGLGEDGFDFEAPIFEAPI